MQCKKGQVANRVPYKDEVGNRKIVLIQPFKPYEKRLIVVNELEQLEDNKYNTTHARQDK